MRSSEVPVRILPFAPFGAPPPLIFLEANAFVQWLAKTRAQKNAPRERRGFALFPHPEGLGAKRRAPQAGYVVVRGGGVCHECRRISFTIPPGPGILLAALNQSALAGFL